MFWSDAEREVLTKLQKERARIHGNEPANQSKHALTRSDSALSIPENIAPKPTKHGNSLDADISRQREFCEGIHACQTMMFLAHQFKNRCCLPLC